MVLKHKKSQVPNELPSDRPEEWSGPWGRINPRSAGFDVVRFCQSVSTGAEKTHSYPYRVISSWHWTNNGTQEELKVEAGGDVITVQGHGLDRIVEALDRGILEILCEIPGKKSPENEQAIWIFNISIESNS